MKVWMAEMPDRMRIVYADVELAKGDIAKLSGAVLSGPFEVHGLRSEAAKPAESQEQRRNDATPVRHPVRVTLGGSEHCLTFDEAHALRDRVIRAIEDAAYPEQRRPEAQTLEGVPASAGERASEPVFSLADRGSNESALSTATAWVKANEGPGGTYQNQEARIASLAALLAGQRTGEAQPGWPAQVANEAANRLWAVAFPGAQYAPLRFIEALQAVLDEQRRESPKRSPDGSGLTGSKPAAAGDGSGEEPAGADHSTTKRETPENRAETPRSSSDNACADDGTVGAWMVDRIAELKAENVDLHAALSRYDAEAAKRMQMRASDRPSVAPSHLNALGNASTCESAERHIVRLSEYLGEANDETERLRAVVAMKVGAIRLALDEADRLRTVIREHGCTSGCADVLQRRAGVVSLVGDNAIATHAEIGREVDAAEGLVDPMRYNANRSGLVPLADEAIGEAQRGAALDECVRNAVRVAFARGWARSQDHHGATPSSRETKGPWLIRRQQPDDTIGCNFVCAIGGGSTYWSQEHKAMRFPEKSDAFFTGGYIDEPVLIVAESEPFTSDEGKKR